ncbi:MAG: DUF58 domain-containing protein [Acidiferrobacter sp.]
MSGAARTLGRRALFLWPTRGGVAFAATLGVLLLAAINYGNGLAYATTFLLAAIAALSLVGAQRNLRTLGVAEEAPRADFAGRAVGFRVVLASNSGVSRFGICVEALGGSAVTVDLAAGERRLVELAWPTTRRGRVPAPVVRVSSRYPFGLVRVVSRRLRLTEPALAYPQPAPQAALPDGLAATDAAADSAGRVREGSGDFAGLMPFRPGASPHHIHWKAAAAGRGLLLKRFAGAADTAIWLSVTGRGPLEARLSRVCRQLLEAERQGFHYGLILGRQQLPLARGRAHCERCLRTLALYDEPHG